MTFHRSELKSGHTSTLHFSPMLLSKTGKGTLSYSLYPYNSDDLAVIFVYGADFQRELNILFVPKSVQTVASLIISLMSLSTIVLYLIRRKLRLQRSDFPAAFIDTWIAFTSGGNLRVENHIERWFFGILLIGVFFISSIFTGDLLECIYRILYQKFTSFDQLAKIEAPVYINPSLASNIEIIREMLR